MSHDSSSSNSLPLVGIAVVIAGYIIAAAAGGPQWGRDVIVEAMSHGDEHHNDEHHNDEHHNDEHHNDEHQDDEHGPDDHGDGGHESGDEHPDEHPAEGESTADAATPHADEHGPPTPPSIVWVVPFVILLLAIATFPLLRFTEHWWEHNLHRFYLAAGLGVITLLYYALAHPHGVEGHWPAHHVVSHSAGGLMLAWTVFANAILYEFIPFIVLLFALYTISGGIRIEGDLQAHPLTNTVFLAVGGGLASFIGTTGAAMLLIRPLLETNAERKHVVHTVVMFIFIVCNCGGCLLPIGDPPLFLGYLRGVPFLWTFSLFWPWLFVNVALLAIYFLWDTFVAYPHETKRDIQRDETQVRRLRFSGWQVNVPLLLGVVLAVALLDPSKTIPGTGWHPWMYLREVVQLGLVGLSLLLGSNKVREANRFNYHAIVEVAALFCGIFICMQPALQILNVQGPALGIDSATAFFWITGGLSSVLDNAPTYVVFFETARTVSSGDNLVAGVDAVFLTAISLGAVFMGAMTYIGNGPNFMVKAIAESSGIRMPSFFGYMLYSIAVLLPLLLITTFIFL